jgi:hypothetical protein
LIATWGWRYALISLAALHLLVCAPLHALALRGAPRPLPQVVSDSQAVAKDISRFIRSPPFLLIGVSVVLMMAVTVALPAHMVSLLRENGLSEVWVIAIPAGIGVIQVIGRLLLYFFEHHLDLHLANRLIPCLIPLGLIALLAAPLALEMRIWILLLFVLLYGLGNGMFTIVKGTVIAQYVNQDFVATLNGALGVPLALARASAPLLLGVMWTQQAGYTHGLWLLLALSLAGVGALMLAQRHALTP